MKTIRIENRFNAGNPAARKAVAKKATVVNRDDIAIGQLMASGLSFAEARGALLAAEIRKENKRLETAERVATYPLVATDLAASISKAFSDLDTESKTTGRMKAVMSRFRVNYPGASAICAAVREYNKTSTMRMAPSLLSAVELVL